MTSVVLGALVKGFAISFVALVLRRPMRSPEDRAVLGVAVSLALIALMVASACLPSIRIAWMHPGSSSIQLGVAESLGLALVFVGGIVLLMVGRSVAHWRVRWLQSHSSICKDRRLLRILSDCARKQGLRSAPELREGPANVAPCTAGWRRTWVHLPATARDWSSDVLESILAHECAHIRLRHALARAISTFALVLHWPNPLVWMLHHHCVVDQELSSDERAMSHGITGPRYAECLLEAVHKMRTVALAAGGSGMRIRIHHAVHGSRRAPMLFGRRIVRVIAGCMLIGLLLGSVSGVSRTDRDRSSTGTRSSELFGAHGLFGPRGLLDR